MSRESPDEHDAAVTVVRQALTALVNASLEEHLRFVSDTIAFQLMDTPPINGKQQYAFLINGLLVESDHHLLAFRITGVANSGTGAYRVSVQEDRVRVYRGSPEPYASRKGTDQTEYTVTNNMITRIHWKTWELRNKGVWTFEIP